MGKLGLKRFEKWGLWLLGLFVAGWLAMLFLVHLLTGNPESTFKSKEIMRQINYAQYKDAANVHLPEFVDWVTIQDKELSASKDTVVYHFKFRIYNEQTGKTWHTGTIEENGWENFENLRLNLEESTSPSYFNL